MADNVTIPATGSGTATPVVATDDITSVHYQIVKVAYGALNTGTLVTASVGLPVIGMANSGVDIGDVTINNASGASAVNIQDGGNSITVDGTVTADTEMPAAAALSDTTSNPTAPAIGAFSMVWNDGTAQWARFPSVVDSQTLSSGAIVAASTILGQRDDTSPTTPAENAWAPVRIGQYRSIHMQIRDGKGADRAALVDYQGRIPVMPAADGVTVSGNVFLAPMRQPINTSTNGAIVVSGQANRKVRVLNGLLMAVTAVTGQFKSGNNSDCTGPLALGATGGFQIPHAPLGNFETQTGENLTLNLSSAVVVGGWLTYVYV